MLAVAMVVLADNVPVYAGGLAVPVTELVSFGVAALSVPVTPLLGSVYP